MLFLKEKTVEEVKFSYPKAKQILAFSFLIGEDFNFFVASNLAIDLYEVKFQGNAKQKTKIVKNITLNMGGGDIYMYVEPMVNFIVAIDAKG